MNDTSRWTLVNDRVLELALGLALMLVGLFRVLLPILGVSGPWSSADSRTVRVDDAARLADATASAALTLRGTGHAEMVLTDPGLGDRLLLALPGVTGGLLVVAILAVLLRMARTFRAA